MSAQLFGSRVRSLVLTKPQQEVVEIVHARLDEAASWIEARRQRVERARCRLGHPLSSATRVWPIDAPPGFADVDQERVDRALLIDGRRGEGKTSVLLKMLDTWGLHALDRASRRRGHTGGIDSQIALPKKVFVVPLPTLDLPAIPRGNDVPLASLVLNCFSSLVTDLLDDARATASDERHQGRPGQSYREGLRESWDWLHRSLASKYSHASKRGKDDFLQYSRDLQDDTRRVYEIDDRFRTFVDLLGDRVAERFWVDDVAPLFVIAIDDLDLAAHATIELLDVLRVFQHPAVYFVVTGDYGNLTRAVMRGPAAAVLFGDRLADQFSEPIARPLRQLASDTVERLFPPRNVIRLHELETQHALDVPVNPPQVTTVRDVLASLAPKVPAWRDVGSSHLTSHETLSVLLPKRLRGLVNLAQSLAEVTRDPHCSAAHVACALWDRTLADRGLDAVDDLKRLLRLRRVADDRFSFTVSDRALLLGVPRNPMTLAREGRIFEIATNVRPLSILRPEVERLLEQHDLEEVFHSVVALILASPDGQSSLDGQVDRTFVRSWYRKDDRLFSCVWPLPDWSLVEFDRFRCRWNHEVGSDDVLDAIRSALISPLDLFVTVVCSALALDQNAWLSPAEALRAVSTVNDKRHVMHRICDRSWETLRRIVKEPLGEPHGIVHDWARCALPPLLSEIGWLRSSRQSDLSYLEEVISCASAEDGQRTFARIVRSESSATVEPGKLPSYETPWEVYDRLDRRGRTKLLDRKYPLRDAPKIDTSIREVLSPESRGAVLREIERFCQSDDGKLQIAELPWVSIEQSHAIDEIGVAADSVGVRLPSELDYSNVLYEKSLVVDVNPVEIFTFDTGVRACKTSFDASGADIWQHLFYDVWVDFYGDGRTLDENQYLIAPWKGVVGSMGFEALWFSPSFAAPYDYLLLSEAWNRYRVFSMRRPLSVLAVWLLIAQCVAQQRSTTSLSLDRVQMASESPIDALSSVFERWPTDESVRDERWRQFLIASVLYASPEAGLDPKDAAQYLDLHTATVPHRARASSDFLKRTFDSFFGEPSRVADARAVAATVLKQQPDHPWLKRYPLLSTAK